MYRQRDLAVRLLPAAFGVHPGGLHHRHPAPHSYHFSREPERRWLRPIYFCRPAPRTLELVEINPEFTVEQVQAATEATLIVKGEPKSMID